MDEATIIPEEAEDHVTEHLAVVEKQAQQLADLTAKAEATDRSHRSLKLTFEKVVHKVFDTSNAVSIGKQQLSQMETDLNDGLDRLDQLKDQLDDHVASGEETLTVLEAALRRAISAAEENAVRRSQDIITHAVSAAPMTNGVVQRPVSWRPGMAARGTGSRFGRQGNKCFSIQDGATTHEDIRLPDIFSLMTPFLRQQIPDAVTEVLATCLSIPALSAASVAAQFSTVPRVSEAISQAERDISDEIFSGHTATGQLRAIAYGKSVPVGSSFLNVLFQHVAAIAKAVIKTATERHPAAAPQLALSHLATKPEKILTAKNLVTGPTHLDDLKWASALAALQAGFDHFIDCLAEELEAVLTRHASAAVAQAFRAQAEGSNVNANGKRPASTAGATEGGTSAPQPKKTKAEKDADIVSHHRFPWPAEGSMEDKTRWLKRKACRPVAQGQRCAHGERCKFLHDFTLIGMEGPSVARIMRQDNPGQQR